MYESRPNYFCRALLCGALLLSTLPLFGQSTSTGTVVGQVTDETDAVVAGATYSIIDHPNPTTKNNPTKSNPPYFFFYLSPITYPTTPNQTHLPPPPVTQPHHLT